MVNYSFVRIFIDNCKCLWMANRITVSFDVDDIRGFINCPGDLLIVQSDLLIVQVIY